MNDASNDGNEATEGILADLANLQQSVNTADSANGDVDESIREKLDHIAEAAGSLRLPEPDEDSDDSDDVVPEPKRSAPKKARDAVANRGLVFEQFVRDSNEDSQDSADSPEAASSVRGVKRTIPRRPTTLRMTPLQTPNRLRRRSILAIPSPRRQPSLRPRRHREALLQCLTMAA